MKTSNLTIYPEEPIVICINHGYSSKEFFGVVVASVNLFNSDGLEEYKLGYMDGFHKKPFKGEFTTTVGEM
jgi:hypothetical protein